MKLLTRRGLLERGARLGLGLVSSCALGACGQRVIEIERIAEREITRIVREVVRETVIVEGTPRVVIIEGTPRVIERMVEKVVTASPRPEPRRITSPAPKPRVNVIADVTDYGWTRFAMLMTPAFEDLFPNIKMRWRSLSRWDEYPQRIATLYASDQLGDLLEAPLGVLPAIWYEEQIIQPIDDIITADGFDPSGIFKGALAACLYQGKHNALPFISHAGENVLLYNKRLFDQAGIAPPDKDWTLQDLCEAGGELTEDLDGDGKRDQFGYAVRYSLPGALPMLHLFGEALFSPDGRQCTIASERGVSCLRWAHDLIHTHRLAPTPAQVERGPLEMFRAGRLAMLRHTFGSLVHLLRTTQGTWEMGATLFPRHPTTGKIATLASGMAYCITRRSRCASDVFQWAKFMSSREMGVQMFLGGYADPGCRPASWKDPRILKLYPICEGIANAANDAEPERLPWNLRVAECMEVWNSELASLCLARTTPEEWAARVTRGIEQVLARPRLRIGQTR